MKRKNDGDGRVRFASRLLSSAEPDDPPVRLWDRDPRLPGTLRLILQVPWAVWWPTFGIKIKKGECIGLRLAAARVPDEKNP